MSRAHPGSRASGWMPTSRLLHRVGAAGGEKVRLCGGETLKSLHQHHVARSDRPPPRFRPASAKGCVDATSVSMRPLGAITQK